MIARISKIQSQRVLIVFIHYVLVANFRYRCKIPDRKYKEDHKPNIMEGRYPGNDFVQCTHQATPRWQMDAYNANESQMHELYSTNPDPNGNAASNGEHRKLPNYGRTMDSQTGSTDNSPKNSESQDSLGERLRKFSMRTDATSIGTSSIDFSAVRKSFRTQLNFVKEKVAQGLSTDDTELNGEDFKCSTPPEDERAPRKMSFAILAKTVTDTAREQKLSLMNRLSTSNGSCSLENEAKPFEIVSENEPNETSIPPSHALPEDDVLCENRRGQPAEEKELVDSPTLQQQPNNRSNAKKSFSVIANSVSLGVRLRRYSMNERGRPLASDSSVTTMGRTPHVSNGQPNNTSEHTQNDKRTVLQTIQSVSIDSNQEEGEEAYVSTTTENTMSVPIADVSHSDIQPATTKANEGNRNPMKMLNPSEKVPDRKKSFSSIAKTVMRARSQSHNSEKDISTGPPTTNASDLDVTSKNHLPINNNTENRSLLRSNICENHNVDGITLAKKPKNSIPVHSEHLKNGEVLDEMVPVKPSSDDSCKTSAQPSQKNLVLDDKNGNHEEYRNAKKSRKLSFQVMAKTAVLASRPRKPSMNESAMKSRSTPVSPRHSQTVDDPFDVQMKTLFAKMKLARRNAVCEPDEDERKRIVKELKQQIRERDKE